RYGDRSAAEHLLRAYEAAAQIPGEVTALAWVPHDLGTSRQLVLPYWYWTEQDPRWGSQVSPARAGVLLPLRYYAKVVAKLGPMYRAEAERQADEAVRLYEIAIRFIWEAIDRKSGNLKGRWDGKSWTLLELIEREKQERKQLATLFGWPPG